MARAAVRGRLRDQPGQRFLRPMPRRTTSGGVTRRWPEVASPPDPGYGPTRGRSAPQRDLAPQQQAVIPGRAHMAPPPALPPRLAGPGTSAAYSSVLRRPSPWAPSAWAGVPTLCRCTEAGPPMSKPNSLRPEEVRMAVAPADEAARAPRAQEAPAGPAGPPPTGMAPVAALTASRVSRALAAPAACRARESSSRPPAPLRPPRPAQRAQPHQPRPAPRSAPRSQRPEASGRGGAGVSAQQT